MRYAVANIYWSGRTKLESRVTLRLLRRREGSRGEVTLVDISGDDTTVLSVSKATKPGAEGWVDCWDINNLKTISKVNGVSGKLSHTGRIFAAVKDRQVCSASNQALHPEVWVIDGASSKAKTQNLLDTSAAIGNPLAFGAQGRIFAAGAADHRVVVYSLQSRSTLCIIMSHIDQVTHAIFAPDGRSLLTASRDSTIRVTDALTGLSRFKFEVPNWHRCQALAITRDGKRVASIWGSEVYLWQLDSGGGCDVYSLGAKRQKEGWPLCISPDGRLLVCRTEGGGVDVSDITSGEVLGMLALGGIATAAAFSSDGSVLAVGKYDGAVELLEVKAESIYTSTEGSE